MKIILILVVALVGHMIYTANQSHPCDNLSLNECLEYMLSVLDRLEMVIDEVRMELIEEICFLS